MKSLKVLSGSIKHMGEVCYLCYCGSQDDDTCTVKQTLN